MCWSISFLSRTLLERLVYCEARAVAGSIVEPRDVVPDFRFAEKLSFLRRGQHASGDLGGQTDNCNFSIVIYTRTELASLAQSLVGCAVKVAP